MLQCGADYLTGPVTGKTAPAVRLLQIKNTRRRGFAAPRGIIGRMWKRIRITILLLILATVALETWRAQRAATSWRDTLQVAVYPINGDASYAAAQRIQALEADSFVDIEQFIAEEVKRYEVPTLQPVRLNLQQALNTLPPSPPERPGVLDSVFWSLKMRWWVWRLPTPTLRPNVRLFVVYHDGSSGRVPTSHGLQRGQIAIAHVFADKAMQRSNAVVIAHELLHTLGATDKYDPATLEPIYPSGYAEPLATPRLPQRFCELMAGRLPGFSAPPEQPRSLAQCLIGEQTAREIGLLRP